MMKKFGTEQEFRIAVYDIEVEIEWRLAAEDPDWEDRMDYEEINEIRNEVYRENGWDGDPRPVKPREGIDYQPDPDEETGRWDVCYRDPRTGEGRMVFERRA